jgi:hypothetical protein
MARVTVDGHPMKTWKEAFKVFSYQGKSWYSTINVRVLSPGENLDLFSLKPGGDEGKATFERLLEQTDHRMGIMLCYCSVLDDCWQAGLGAIDDPSFDPERVLGSCQIPAEDRFTN